MSTDQVADQKPPQVAEPTPAEEPKTEKAPATAGGLPAKALAVVVGAALALFAITVWAGWRYIVRTPEASERDDWDQLLGLIDKVDNLVLFLLGAIFGVAVQHGQTAVASRAAATNE